MRSLWEALKPIFWMFLEAWLDGWTIEDVDYGFDRRQRLEQRVRDCKDKNRFGSGGGADSVG